MKRRNSHSSTNSDLNPYAKYNFKGTEATIKAMKDIGKKPGTKELMSHEQWIEFCKTRK